MINNGRILFVKWINNKEYTEGDGDDLLFNELPFLKIHNKWW